MNNNGKYETVTDYPIKNCEVLRWELTKLFGATSKAIKTQDILAMTQEILAGYDRLANSLKVEA